MSKHTPGPWYMRPAANGAGDFGICANAPSVQLGAVVVAEVFAELEYEGERSTQTPHNAQLIAAAPDLLEALKALDECYCEASDEMSRAQRAHHRKVLLDARAAIAKATGSPA